MLNSWKKAMVEVVGVAGDEPEGAEMVDRLVKVTVVKLLGPVRERVDEAVEEDVVLALRCVDRVLGEVVQRVEDHRWLGAGSRLRDLAADFRRLGWDEEAGLCGAAARLLRNRDEEGDWVDDGYRPTREDVEQVYRDNYVSGTKVDVEAFLEVVGTALVERGGYTLARDWQAVVRGLLREGGGKGRLVKNEYGDDALYVQKGHGPEGKF